MLKNLFYIEIIAKLLIIKSLKNVLAIIIYKNIMMFP